MPPQRTSNLNLTGTDSCSPVNVTMTICGETGHVGPTGPCGPRGPPGPQGGMTGIGYEPLPSSTYNEFTPGIKTFEVPNESTNAFISGMYIRIRDVIYPSWFMNGTIISYIGTTLKVDVDSVTLGEDILPSPSHQPCGTTGTVGHCNTSSTGYEATSLTHTPGVITYTSNTRNEFVDSNQIFVVENVPEGIFSPGIEVRVTDYFYPSWYMDATVLGYTGENLSLDIDSVQFGAGEIINELTSDTSLKFEIGIKDFTIENTTRIVAFSKDTTVRITTPDICIGTYMNGIVISFIGNILKVRIDSVTTVTGFNLYTGFVSDWCIQSLVNNDKYSGNNWRISIRNPRGLYSTSRVAFSNGEKALNITSGPIDIFNISRGVRISDNTYPSYYMDGIISGYTGTFGYTGATGTSILVQVENTNRATPPTAIYRINSTSTHSFSTGLKTFVVPIIKTISAIGVGSNVRISPFNTPISSVMTGIVNSYIGTNLVVNVNNVATDMPGDSIYTGNLSSWNIQALPVSSILSGSDWFITLRNPVGARSDTRNSLSISSTPKTFIIQDGSTNSFTTGVRLRVIDRTYPSFYMEGTVSSFASPNLSLLIDYQNFGFTNTNIVGELSSISSHKFEVGQKNFVVQDIKKLHGFTATAQVELKPKNLWVGITLKGIVISYIGTNLLINITTIERPTLSAGFDDYTEFVNNWTIEISGFSPAPSGSDWVIVNAPTITLGVPTSVTAIRGDREVVVNWFAPVNPNGIIRYIVFSNQVGDTGQYTTDTTTSLVFTGLTNDTQYTFRVRAVGYVNSIVGALSNPSPGITPRAGPRILNVIAGDRIVRINWKIPSDTTLITQYRLTSTPAPQSGFPVRIVSGGLSNIFDFDNLTNDTSYTFTVSALDTSDNVVGELSAPSAAVIPRAGPSFLTVIPGNTSALISWTQPSNTTGITSYSVTGTPISNLP
jgi:hypothetical protein